jgi:hypothetical protein
VRDLPPTSDGLSVLAPFAISAVTVIMASKWDSLRYCVLKFLKDAEFNVTS